MGVEIERKFLVADGAAVPDGRESDVRQGYLAAHAEGGEARLRRQDGAYSLTVKRGSGPVRGEWETPLDAEQFAVLWPATDGTRIHKTRRVVPLGPHEAVVDTFHGRLAGLRTVEVEFADRRAAAAFTPPPWFGPEVTDRPAFANRNLATATEPPRPWYAVGSGAAGARPAAPGLIDTVAWVRLEGGRILCARPRGKDAFYIPGGKREGGESDLQTLLREVAEELSVTLLPDTVTHVDTYRAAAHAQAPGTLVSMACYTADYTGTLTASSEIEEVAWFSYADRDRVPPVDQDLFDDLHRDGLLR